MGDFPMVNHAEMVYRPGDREAARALFETMGCAVGELPGFPWLIINIDASVGGALTADNIMYANESTPAQQNLEAALEEAIAANPNLAEKLERYKAIRLARPQYVHHFGASVATHEDWLSRVEALQDANANHPLLRGRIEVDVREPGHPGALGPLSQAFIHSDIIQVAPLQMGGILFDLQWSPTVDPADIGPIEFPDRMQMV